MPQLIQIPLLEEMRKGPTAPASGDGASPAQASLFPAQPAIDDRLYKRPFVLLDDDLELRLERNNPSQQSLLSITILMRSPEGLAATTPAWKARCNQVFCDLRAYLMGQGGSVADPVH